MVALKDIPASRSASLERKASERRLEIFRFRPDIEGLRAVAVLLVVLYHAHLLGVRGGYIGVDVFFVISGYLITSVLLRELDRTENGPTLQRFYARRIRRLLSASALVLIATVIAGYHWLGFLSGDQIARDARWCAAFLANIHFARMGTDYLSSQAPPSPLQHFWSLAVEEQFYLVWPVLFVVTARMVRRDWLTTALGTIAASICGVSLLWCIVQTRSNGTWAYFSPLTRAWEIGAGVLIAIFSVTLSRLPRAAAAAASWVGLGAIVVSAFWFGTYTKFPGSAALLPVLGSAAVIVGGIRPVRFGSEKLLGLKPLMWLGALSYSFYLWHWPVLVIGEQRSLTPLSASHRVFLLILALALSIATFWVVERPIRRSKSLARLPVLTYAMGAGLVLAVFAFTSWTLGRHAGVF